MSKLDYCNALLPGSSKVLLTKLQCIQNMGCRIVCSLRKFDHVTRPMYDLHWLCFQERIDHKIACIMFKHCDGTAPQYHMDLLPKRQSKWQLRSSSSNVCQIKFFKTSQGYNSSFFSYGLRIWNSLPYELHHAQSFDSSGRVSRHICLRLHMTRIKFTSSNLTFYILVLIIVKHHRKGIACLLRCYINMLFIIYKVAEQEELGRFIVGLASEITK